MKVTVFGAGGGTGSEVVRQALALGHEVIAVVRDPVRLPHQANPHLEVVAADVMNPASIQDAVTGRDAVISTIGSRNPRAPTTVSAGRAAASSRPCGPPGCGGWWRSAAPGRPTRETGRCSAISPSPSGTCFWPYRARCALRRPPRR